MRRSWARWWWQRRWWLAPVAVFVALSLPALFGGRWDTDMGWYAGISRSIVERGDAWHLYAGDRVYFNKPPMAFWLSAACLWLFGGHDWSVRLSGWLCACACVAVTAALVRKWHGPRAGLAAGLVMGSTPELVRVSTQFRLDVPHLLFILLAALGVLVAAKRELAGRRGHALAWPMLCSGAAIGLALMTKPFFSPLTYLFMAPWLVWVGARRTTLWMVPALVVGMAVAAPWHASMAIHYGRPFVDEYLGRQTIGRGLGTAFESDPWWYYLKLLAVSYWPWLAAIALAVVALARGQSLSRNRGGVVLAVVWSLLWIVAVSVFADKRRQYLLPAYLGLAWIAGLWVANIAVPSLMKGRRAWVDWAAVTGLAISVVLTATGVLSRPLQKHWVDLFAFIREREGREGPVELWAGSVNYSNAGMIGAVTGHWPRTIDWTPDHRTPPPVGALVLFSEAPPPAGAEVVFQSGSVVVARWPSGMHDPRDRDHPPENSALIFR